MAKQPTMQVRIARPTRSIEAAVACYSGLLGLPILASFDDHDGYSGVIFGLPDASRQLEVVSGEGVVPTPTTEDQLVFYLGSKEEVASLARRLRAGGLTAKEPPNPYFGKHGGVCFVDADGYWIVLSPESW